MSADDLGFVPIAASNQDADDLGFVPESAQDKKTREKSEKFGSTGQQIATGLEGAASAGTFGLSTGLERALGVPAEDIQARREENPISHGVGQAAGLVGSLAIPGVGAAGAMERVGAGAAEALGLGAAQTFGAKVGSAAVKSAVENVLFQSGDEVSKMISSDPAQTVGTAAANVALSGLIGGGFGAGLGSVNPLWEASFGKKTQAALTDLSNQAEHAANGSLTTLPENYHQAGMLSDLVATPKPNMDEIVSASNTLGITPPLGATSDAEFAQRLASHLNKRESFAGVEVFKDQKRFWGELSNSTKSVFRDATEKSEYEGGNEIKKGLLSKIKEIFDPLHAEFKANEPHYKAVDVSDNFKNTALTPLKSLGRAGQELADEISPQIKNVYDLNVVRTDINGRIQDALAGRYKGASRDLESLFEAKKALTSMREGAMESATKLSGIEGAEKVSSEMIAKMRSLDKRYAEGKALLKQLGIEGSLGNVNSLRQLTDKFNKLAAEDMPKKVLNLNDVDQMKFMKEKFPEQFELARRLKLSEIRDKSIDEGLGEGRKFSVGKALGQIQDSKLGPEAKQILFEGQIQKLDAARTLYSEAIKNFNPSGTGPEMSLGKLFTPSGLINNVADSIKLAVLKNTPRLMKAAGTTDAKATGLAAMMFLKAGQAIEAGPFKAAVDMISSVLKADNQITKGVGNVFKAGREIIPSKVMEKKDFDKLDKRLIDLQSNVNPLFESGGKVAGYMPEAGAHISEVAVNAVNYLNQLRPSKDKKMPLDGAVIVNKPQQAAYYRALEIAEQPLVVLNDIKQGSITPADVLSLRTMYPGLYDRINQKLNDGIIDKTSDEEPIPYKTRLGIALFMGEPLDSTMTPASIQAIQATGMSQPQQPQAPAQGQRGSGPHSMKDLNKLASSYATPDQARAAHRLKS